MQLPGVMLDPSRVAAQIVSGIGFIGAGLTTAATVWPAAAVGTAAGAGLWLLATAVTAAHFLVTYGYPAVSRRLLATALIDVDGVLTVHTSDPDGAER